MPDKKRWKAIANYRRTHDTNLVISDDFEEISDIDTWIERGPDWRTLESLVVYYNLGDPNKPLTLAQIEAENGAVKAPEPTVVQ